MTRHLCTLSVLCAVVHIATQQVVPATVTDEYGNTADADSQLTFVDLPAIDPYETDLKDYDDGGLTPYFNGVHGFVNICFGDIPYGRFIGFINLMHF